MRVGGEIENEIGRKEGRKKTLEGQEGGIERGRWDEDKR